MLADAGPDADPDADPGADPEGGPSRLIFAEPAPRPLLRRAIDVYRAADETACVRTLAASLDTDDATRAAIAAEARRLVLAVRGERAGRGGLEAFQHEYGLSNREGVLLMCVAESLLRIPDDGTKERLIRDKLSAADWERHLGRSRSLFVNASTWALMLTGRLMRLGDEAGHGAGAAFRRLVARLGEPVVREAVDQAMRIMGRQYVIGRSIEEALENGRALERQGYRLSYDMLGEAARTRDAARRYVDAYRRAIGAIGAAAGGRGVYQGPGISVKLSALCPRFEPAQTARVARDLVPEVAALAVDAARCGIGMTIDAEEVERLDVTLDVIEALSGDPRLTGWDGLGVVVQAYLKAAPAIIAWLADLARRHRRRLMVRLVKGAYWDAEIKRAQQAGLDGYPVFTRKASTDVSFLAAVRRLLAAAEAFYPQFATHNAHSAAAVLAFAGDRRDFEFQRLHGMGDTLHAQLCRREGDAAGCRVYAPVGGHEDLLPYLVRRLLENGANSSFVNRLQDDRLPVEAIVADPVRTVQALAHVPHPGIPLPRHLHLPGRLNARGLDLADPGRLADLAREMAAADRGWTAAPIVGGRARPRGARPVHGPADRGRPIGTVAAAAAADVAEALTRASAAAREWAAVPVAERAACLDAAAGLMEAAMPELMALAVREAGKTIPDAVAEVREAVDFCRYYAERARTDLDRPLRLPLAADGALPALGRTVRAEGGGVFACISPWNFPLAIFTGQATAALVAGNAVIAKPAEQTPLMAAAAVRLLHRAGIPGDVLHLLPGDGARIGGALVADARVGGVVFTGSTAVAAGISRTLAARPGRSPPVLIAETGGQNAMIVDSTALPEQVVRDVIAGAFQSAGQRCSALRVLFLQADVADRIIRMLAGAMEELVVGDPALLATDIGPVIDPEAHATLAAHIRRMEAEARPVGRAPTGAACAAGTFVAPVAFEIDRLDRVAGEVFGPVLHVLRYPADRLDDVVDRINATGYGLTLGIQTRIDATWRAVFARAHAGNTYVNRNQIGAVVGVQPFGGQGLSGTGPKAGGPHYLDRFVAEIPLDAAPPPSAPDTGPPPTAAVRFARPSLAAAAAAAAAAGPGWGGRSGEERALVLERAATVFAAEAGGGAARAADYLRFVAAQLRSTLAMPQPLPGPTGEENELWFRPRGLVVCLAAAAAAPAALAAQLAAAVGPGNTAMAWHPDAERLDRVIATFAAGGVPAGVITRLAPGNDGDLAHLVALPPLAAASVAGPAALVEAVLGGLGRRDGPIVPLILHREGDEADMAEQGGIGHPLATSPRYLRRFVHERTLTIDTTASGGNAALLGAAADG
jgi:RHH-type proline utilization regulon transcriptional repressor/proline dehydrogenase/delta 1-pyrroline-5-carboxylate dehydrogenase